MTEVVKKISAPPITRRRFVSASVGAAGTMMLGRSVGAQHFSWSELQGVVSANDILPESISPDTLRTLAMVAIDAARTAGAQYADARVAESHQLRVSVLGSSAIPTGGVSLFPRFAYGIRVLVNGAWAFRHGTIAMTDALATAAYEAVQTAKGYALLNTHIDEVPQRTLVTGQWETPYVLDPFTVPLMDQCALAAAFIAAGERVRNGSSGPTSFNWRRETRVFAATDGSCITQTFRRAEPTVTAAVSLPRVSQTFSVPIFSPMIGGYECVARPGVEEEIKREIQKLAPLVWLPRRTMDVGRYPAVMNGNATGMIFLRTVGRAMELDRVLGHEMSGSGGSYLSPAEEILGTGVASPMLTVMGQRHLPTGMAAQWDDDGVVTKDIPLIRSGQLLSYAMSCRTAPVVPGQLLSNGCAAVYSVEHPVMVRLPHVTIASGEVPANTSDLYRDIRHGVYIQNATFCSTDSIMASGLIDGYRPMLEIKNGKLVSVLRGNALQFSTPQLWKGLDMLGDSGTVRSDSTLMGKGMPSTSYLHTATAPAARFKAIDIISTRF